MKPEEFAAHTDLLTYVLQDDVHNRLTPRVVDIAYTAFMISKQPNTEDGGPSDWFNDTKPHVMAAIDKLRKDLMEDRAGHDDPVKVPSDAELEKAWDSFEAEIARHPTDDELEEFMSQFTDEAGHIHDDQHAEAARALLASYGQPAQPNVPEPLKYGGKWKDHYVTGWNNCRAAMLEAAPEPKEPK